MRKYKWVINGKANLAKILLNTKPLDGCLIWQGGLFSSGYGKVCLAGKAERVHRVVYEAYYEEDITLLCVRHTCGSYACINPVHLRLGDRKLRVRAKSSRSGKRVRRTKAQLGKPYKRRKNAL